MGELSRHAERSSGKPVAKQKEQTKEVQGNKPNAGRMLTEEEINIVEGQSLLGCSCSWLNNSQLFGLRFATSAGT